MFLWAVCHWTTTSTAPFLVRQATNALHCLTSILYTNTHTLLYENITGYSDNYMHTNIYTHTRLSLTRTLMYSAVTHTHTWATRILCPATEEVSWIFQLLLYTAMQELIGYLQGKEYWPQSDTRRIKKRTDTHTHSHSHSRQETI